MSLIKSPSLTITGPFGSCWEMRHLSWHCRGIKDKNKRQLNQDHFESCSFEDKVHICPKCLRLPLQIRSLSRAAQSLKQKIMVFFFCKCRHVPLGRIKLRNIWGFFFCLSIKLSSFGTGDPEVCPWLLSKDPRISWVIDICILRMGSQDVLLFLASGWTCGCMDADCDWEARLDPSGALVEEWDCELNNDGPNSVHSASSTQLCGLVTHGESLTSFFGNRISM